MVRRALPMRCLIVDASPHLGAAARLVLEGEEITVVGVASTIADARRSFQALQPDVTLVDIDLGGQDGFELAKQLHQASSPTPSPVILISSYAEQDFADMIAESPVAGFLAKSALSPAAIRQILGGYTITQQADHGTYPAVTDRGMAQLG